MNTRESDVLAALLRRPYEGQRSLAERSGHSLGAVNQALKSLIQEDYLDAQMQPTEKTRRMIADNAPRNAIILAAGYGMRMVPINMETPKGLLEVKGEALIERTIRQLHEAGIREIYIVVGFMKEQYEYLTDKYGVELIVNPDYAGKNNLHSLAAALPRLSNTYVIPCDIRCGVNPFRRQELYSWYMVSDLVDEASDVRVNRKMELVRIPENSGGNAMVGIAYLLEKDAKVVRDRIHTYAADKKYDSKFWEETLYEKDRMIVQARLVRASDFVELNTYEQLRELDSESNKLKSDALKAIAKQLKTGLDAITDIATLKKGTTNHSFVFTCKGKRYVMRIPCTGTGRLIDRAAEARVYKTISGLGFCDDPVYIDPENGYKLTRYLDDVRKCDAYNEDDVRRAMAKLREFHSKRLTVDFTFDLFKQIQVYEDLWGGRPSVYRDYKKTKENVFSLKPFIERARTEWCLTHVDAVADNFLFYPQKNRNGEVIGESLQLTDWEYAGMQDPDLDLAMFSIYSFYDKEQVDHLIDVYYSASTDSPASAVSGGNGENNKNVTAGESRKTEQAAERRAAVDKTTRLKIYCYVAAAGLLWSNWCEYKNNLGVEFGEYSLRQYRYAKEFYRIAVTEGKELIDGGMARESLPAQCEERGKA